ncbi:MAG: hypothetical protein ACRDXX_16055 [Stackebrandtia sp.]
MLAESSANACLTVVGARMRGPLRSRLPGSTAYGLVHRGQSPLAIVHSSYAEGVTP